MSPRRGSAADGVVAWTHPGLDDALQDVVGPPTSGPAAWTLAISASEVSDAAAVPQGPEACYADETRAIVWGQWIAVTDGSSALWIAPGGASVDVRLHPASLAAPRRFGGITCTLAIGLALRLRARFHVHAAALELDGTALLVAGDSGAGKTTTALALALGGAAWGGDDIAYLRMSVDGEVLAEPTARAFHVRPTTVAMFPQIAAHAVPMVGDAGGRVALSPAKALGGGVWRGPRAPRALLFPQVTANPVTRAVALSDADAFGRLLTASALVLAHAVPGADQHFAALQQLVAQCACFSLELGADAVARPEVIVEVLRSELRGQDLRP
ncbi:MAG: hypothetical protein H6700_12715 [Myxococcales bacterium]|nr:hypothetical protein [Myxococcales bacterium]MCB9520965.1 hypothetical protein [Myxococcales bacterium]MCB9532622.1 hypothetical protein [Myxococcales bacterium]